MASIYDSFPLDVPEVLEAPIEEPTPLPKRNPKREALTASERRTGQRRMYEMVETAFETLEVAMSKADFSTAVKAAQIVLDRSGFGPRSNVDVTTISLDLTDLSKEELLERVQRLASRIQGPKIIDVTPETVQ